MQENKFIKITETNKGKTEVLFELSNLTTYSIVGEAITRLMKETVDSLGIVFECDDEPTKIYISGMIYETKFYVKTYVRITYFNKDIEMRQLENMELETVKSRYYKGSDITYATSYRLSKCIRTLFSMDGYINFEK